MIERILQRANRHKTWLNFNIGCRSIRRNKKKRTFLIIYIIISMLILGLFPLPDGFLINQIWKIIKIFVFPFVFLCGLFYMLVRFGMPKNVIKMGDNLFQIGLINHAGQTPTIYDEYKHPENSNITVSKFISNGIPLKTWIDNKTEIESILDCIVVKTVEQKNSKENIIMYTAPASSAYPEVLYWRDELLSDKSFELVLGENLLGRETINLAKIPHILLGGASGSGKTILLKSLIMQCAKKGAEIHIADFKGGVDFPYRWREKCNIVTQETDLLETLTNIVDKMEQRKVIFCTASCRNLDEYNKNRGGTLSRIIVACDEIMEVLDKTNLPKERKEIVDKIEEKISKIARQGRAFGINLIIATQRPDCSISGQIRSNISFRVCGRADEILSKMIIDKTDAKDQIPNDAEGLFITNDGTIFKGYMFDEDKVDITATFSHGSCVGVRP